MSSEQWREEFESEFTSMDFSKQIGNDKFYCYSEINQYWNVWKAARKKAQQEIDGLNEKLALIKEIKQYPTALAYISELKEELKRERLFSSKFEIQSMKGYPTPKEWSELSLENMKTQQRRRTHEL